MRRLVASVIACIVAAAGVAAEADPLAAWAGTWRGRCERIPPSQEAPDFEVSFTIAASAGGAYTWRIVYEANGSLPHQVRNYEIVPVDTAKGHYLLDEKNGLKLDAFAAGRAIYLSFTISGNRITAHYELLSEGGMLMNLPLFDQAPVRNTCLDSNPALCADSFRLKGAQNCRLRRQP